MFGLNGWEIPAIVLLALLFFGGKKLPELAKGFGESLRTVKKEMQGVADDADEIKGEIDSLKNSVKVSPKSKKSTVVSTTKKR